VSILLQTFSATHTVLKIGEDHSDNPSFSLGIFSHMKRLDQSARLKILMDYNLIYQYVDMIV